MTFPTIPTAGANTLLTTNQATATTTHTFPSLTTLDNASGDLLLAIIVTYLGGSTNADFSSWGGGFTEFVDQATNSSTVQSIGAAYKFSDGTETGTFTVTSAGSTRSVMFLLSVKGAHASTVPEATARATGTTGAADPASLNPTNWDVLDTLWIAVGVNGETSLTGTFTGITAAPTNYSGYVDSGIIGGDVIGALEGALGFRQNAVAAEDAGGFTLDTGAAGNSALLIAVRPAPAIVTGTVTSDLGFSGSATGTPIPAAVAAYAFDEGSGLVAADAISARNLGAFNTTDSWNASGHTGSAMHNTGAGGGAGGSVGPSASQAVWTVMFWMRREGTWSGTRAPFGETSTNWNIKINDATGYIIAFWGGTSDLTSGQAATLDTWYHVAVVRSGTDTQMYIDGVASGSAAANGAHDFGADHLVVGWPAGAGGEWDGSVDDLRIFDVALTQAQIAAYMAIPVAAAPSEAVVMSPLVTPSRPVRSWR